jgi:hypothetical protein
MLTVAQKPLLPFYFVRQQMSVPIPASPLSHFRVRSQGYSSRASCELARQLMTEADIGDRFHCDAPHPIRIDLLYSVAILGPDGPHPA